MKNLKLSSLLAMLVCAFVFTSCSDDDNVGSASDLVGTWQSVQKIYWEKVDGVMEPYYDTEWHECTDEKQEFTADGKLNIYGLSNNKWKLDFSGDYTYRGSMIMVSDMPGEEFYPVGKVLVLNSTTLEIEEHDYDDEDDREYYSRIQFRKL